MSERDGERERERERERRRKKIRGAKASGKEKLDLTTNTQLYSTLRNIVYTPEC